jgi:hypothetical protein
MAGKGKRGNGEGSIVQRPDGTWRGQLTLANGHKKDFRAKTYAEARSKLARLIRERDMGLPAVRDERQTVAQYLASWLEIVRSTVRDSAYISYEKKVRLYLVPRLGRVKLAALSPQQVREAYAWMLTNGLSYAVVA